MGTIDDVRRVIQDLVAPDLKAIHAVIAGNETASKLRDEALSAKIDNVDKALSAKIDDKDAASKLRDDALSAAMALKFEIVLNEMKANHASVLNALNVDKRLQALESSAVKEPSKPS